MKKTKKILALALLIAGSQVAKSQLSTTSNLWKISGNGLHQPSYIYMTTALCDSKLTLTQKVNNALHDVQGIIVESNVNSKTNAAKLQMLTAAQSDSQRIKSILPTATYTQLINYASDTYGWKEIMVNQIKPFYVNAVLMVGSNPCDPTAAAEKVEDVLDNYARKNNLSYKELFSPEEVIAEYDAYPTQYWKQNISYLFANGDQVKVTLQNKNNMYLSENADGLKRLFTTNSFYKLKINPDLIKSHNQKSLAKIESIIKTQSTFISVDASNFLATDYSLFELLQKQGYSLTPVQ